MAQWSWAPKSAFCPRNRQTVAGNSTDETSHRFFILRWPGLVYYVSPPNISCQMCFGMFAFLGDVEVLGWFHSFPLSGRVVVSHLSPIEFSDVKPRTTHVPKRGAPPPETTRFPRTFPRGESHLVVSNTLRLMVLVAVFPPVLSTGVYV